MVLKSSLNAPRALRVPPSATGTGCINAGRRSAGNGMKSTETLSHEPTGAGISRTPPGAGTYASNRLAAVRWWPISALVII